MHKIQNRMNQELLDWCLLQASEFAIIIGAKRYLKKAARLIADGANAEVLEDYEKKNLMHLAARYGTPDMVPLFVKAGCDVNGRNINDWTPISTAIMAHRPDMARAFVAAGTDLEKQVVMLWTALHVAVYHGTPEIVKIVAEAGGNEQARDYRGDTPLKLAERHKKSASAAYLRNSGPALAV